MPSTSSIFLLSVTMLAALALYVTGSPIVHASTEPSDYEETSSDALEAELPSNSLSSSPHWTKVIGATNHHEKQFIDEFRNEVEYHFLDHYIIPSPQAGCSNINKESCFQKVAQGLYKYMVLLKHVEKEYPDNSIPPTGKYYGGVLIQLTKEKMRHPEQVVELTTSEQEQLLNELNNPNPFHRKMTAHNILRLFRFFLIDSNHAIAKKERQMRRTHNVGSNAAL